MMKSCIKGHCEEGYEEGMKRGMAQGKKESTLKVLEELGSIPKEIKKKITSQKELKVLSKWLKMAAKAESIEQFLINM